MESTTQTHLDLQNEIKIMQYSEECGCSLGGKFLLFFLIGYGLSFAYLQEYFLQVSVFGHLLRLFFFGILSSLVGKVLGILLARVRLRLLIKKLERSRE